VPSGSTMRFWLALARSLICSIKSIYQIFYSNSARSGKHKALFHPDPAGLNG
jgi:hypothetical protein